MDFQISVLSRWVFRDLRVEGSMLFVVESISIDRAELDVSNYVNFIHEQCFGVADWNLNAGVEGVQGFGRI